VSPAIADMLGYSVNEALQIPYMDLVHPDDRRRAHDAIAKQVVGGERIDAFVGRMRHKNGTWRVLSWRSMPRGRLMFATARDVTHDIEAANATKTPKETTRE